MKRTKLVILLSIVLIGGVVLAAVWFNLQVKKGAEGKEQVPKVATGDTKMQLEKVRFVEDKEGRKTWELEAQSVQQYEDQNLLVLKDVKVTVYTKEGRSFVISGNEAKFYQNSKNAELKGNVVVTSNDGYRLRTQSVSYNHQERKVTTFDRVEIDGDQIQVQGKGLMVDMEARMFKILGQVKTQWRRAGKG